MSRLALLLSLTLAVPTSVLANGGPPPGVEIIAPLSRTVAVMSANARHVAWVSTSGRVLHVKDRQTTLVADLDVATLVPGAAANWISHVDAISDDGRYVVLTGQLSQTYSTSVTTIRFDRQTSTPLVVRQGSNNDPASPIDVMAFTPVSMSRDGQTLAWLLGGALPATPTSVRLWRESDPVAREIGTSCIVQGRYGSVEPCASGPTVSGDGAFVLYTAGSTTAEALAVYDVASGAKVHYPQVQPWTHLSPPTIMSTNTGDQVLTRQRYPTTVGVTLGLLDRATGTVDALPELGLGGGGYDPRGLSDDAQRVLLYGGDGVAYLDRRSGLVFTLPATLPVGISGDGRFVLAWQTDPTTLEGDLRVIDLDADDDGMLDGWETYFGLNPADPTDAALDADSDGVTNGQEFALRSHPAASTDHTRLFAEGAAGTFFDTTLSLFNPSGAAVDAVVRFIGPEGGTAASRTLRLAPKGRADLSSCCIGTLTATEFGIVVESASPIVADRRVTWDRVSGYGSHASTAVPAPSTTWYFAEGATIGGIQTFVLLQNPGAVAGTATVDFLLADGTQETRVIAMPAQSRQTIWVNQEGGALTAGEFATVVTATVPIVAERAVYRDAGGQLFAAGTNAIGATALADAWYFAEGTTKGDFDTFVLLANPGNDAVTVTATFAGSAGDGTPISEMRSYALAPRSRLTVWVDEVSSALANADVTTSITATAPIVAERAMWWRAGTDEWVEGHVEFGATTTGLHFVIADAITDPSTNTDTFVLIGTPDGAPAVVRVTAYSADGTPRVAEFETTGARATVWMRQAFPDLVGPYSLEVLSLGDGVTPTPIVVEKAIYSRGFAAGAAAKAARMPDL